MRHPALVAQVQQVASDIRFAERVRRAARVLRQPANRLDVGSPCVGREAGRDHVVDHTTTQGCHRGDPPPVSPAYAGTESLSHPPRYEVATPSTSARYGEAVQSNGKYVHDHIFRGSAISIAVGYKPVDNPGTNSAE